MRRALAATGIAAALMFTGCTSAAPAPRAPTHGQPTLPAYAQEPSVSQLVAEAIGACMTDLGWAVHVSADAGVGLSGPVPDGQAEVYQADMRRCGDEAAALHPSLTASALPDDALERAWRREQQSWECLREAGHEVEAVPSLTVYVDRLRNGPEYSTWLHLDHEAVGSAEWERLQRLCPDPLQWFGG